MSETADMRMDRLIGGTPHWDNSSRSLRGVLAGWWPGVFLAAEHSINALHCAQHSLVVKSFLGEDGDVISDDAVNQVIANSLKATRSKPYRGGWQARWVMASSAMYTVQPLAAERYNDHLGFDLAHLHERRAASHGTVLGGRDDENNSLLVTDLSRRVPALKHLQHVIMISSML